MGSDIHTDRHMAEIATKQTFKSELIDAPYSKGVSHRQDAFTQLSMRYPSNSTL